MKLDRSTYEAWLLDRIEGRLTPAQERELDAFLAANPDLEAATDALPGIEAEGTSIDWKRELKKSFPPTGDPDRARLNDFLAARLERELSPEQELALDRFLFEHPELAQEAKRMAASKVDAAATSYDDKAGIERHFPPQGMPDRHRLTDFLVAALEGDLTTEQRTALSSYVKAHPEAQREERLVAATRIEAQRMVFFGKDRLKKKEGRVVVMWQRYAAAASIALLIGAAWWMLREKPVGEQEMARQEEVKGVQTQTPEVKIPDGQQEGVQPQEPGTETVRGQQEPGAQPQAPQPGNLPEERSVPMVPAPIPVEERRPEPQLANEPRVEPSIEQTPVAHESDPPVTPEQDPDNEAQPTAQAGAPEAAGRSAQDGSTIGELVANKLRDEVLETAERSKGLDRKDAVAALDKGVNAITGGKGGVEVQRTGTRDRVKLRLGRNLAISASRGH